MNNAVRSFDKGVQRFVGRSEICGKIFSFQTLPPLLGVTEENLAEGLP